MGISVPAVRARSVRNTFIERAARTLNGDWLYRAIRLYLCRSLSRATTAAPDVLVGSFDIRFIGWGIAFGPPEVRGVGEVNRGLGATVRYYLM